MSPPPSSRPVRLLVLLARPFAKVEPQEAIGAALATLTVFCLLTAYYLLKVAREPLILLHGGAEVKSYAAAGQAVLLVGLVHGYSAIARRVGRLQILTIVYCFFAANLLVFAALAAFTNVPIGVPFYLWVGVFNYTALAQFWAFAADIYTPEQGKRLFAILGIGSSLGAVLGSRIAGMLVPLGPGVLMLVAAALLVLCVSLFRLVDRRVARPANAGPAAPEEPLTHEGAFHLIARDRYLTLVAMLTLLINWVNSSGEYLLDRTLLQALAQGDVVGDPATFVGRFKADYFGWVNLISMLLQLFAVSRILEKVGVRASLAVLPLVAAFGYGIMVFAPVLALIRVVKIAENSIDYSLQNTARQALYLVTSRVEKYVGKTAVDTVFVRAGDVLSAVVVWISVQLGLSISRLAAFNLVLVALWLLVLVHVGREHRRRSGEAPELVALEPVTA